MTGMYLEHYGVLGMKWGVRRTPEQLGHDPKTGKYVPHSIKKGTTLYRVSARPEDAKGSKYFTMLPPDRDFYRGIYSTQISKQQGGDGSAYETSYKTTKELKIANRKDLIDEFERVKKNPKLMKTMLTDYAKSLADVDLRIGRIATEDQRVQLGNAYVKLYLSRFKDLPVERQFTAMSRGMAASMPVYRESIIKSLKKKGFDGYIDEGGVGGVSSDREGVEPLVIFDAEKNISVIKTEKINSKTINKANQRYNEWNKIANDPINVRRGRW